MSVNGNHIFFRDSLAIDFGCVSNLWTSKESGDAGTPVTKVNHVEGFGAFQPKHMSHIGSLHQISWIKEHKKNL